MDQGLDAANEARRSNLRAEMAQAFDRVMEAIFRREKPRAEAVRDAELRVENEQAAIDRQRERMARSDDARFVKQSQDWIEHRQRILEAAQRRLAELRDESKPYLAAKVQSSYSTEANKLSGKAGPSGYWSRPTEMFARAFESYVFDRIKAEGRKSDYLVQGVEPERYATGYKGNPYPAAERPAINAAFDHLFATMATREGEGGRPVLFSPRLSPKDFESARQAIDRVVQDVKRGAVSGRAEPIGGVTPWLAVRAREAGLDIVGYRHAVDASAIRHIFRRHADQAIEKSRGQVPVTPDDLRRIPEILAGPDYLVFGGRSGRGLDAIGYLKRLDDGSMFYLEERRSRRQELAALSFRRYPAGTRAEDILTSLGLYARSDGGDDLKVVRADGRSSALLPLSGGAAFSPRLTGENPNRRYTPEQRKAFENVGRAVEPVTLGQRVAAVRQDLGKKLLRETLDPYIGVKADDPEGYMALRLANSSNGAIEQFMKVGTLRFNGHAYDIDRANGGVEHLLIPPLHGDADDFLWWVAANRADRLKAEDRENLFSNEDIASLKQLNRGTVDFDYQLPNGQIPLAARTRKEAGVKTWAVGIIPEPEQAERIIASGDADCTAHARPFSSSRAGRGMPRGTRCRTTTAAVAGRSREHYSAPQAPGYAGEGGRLGRTTSAAGCSHAAAPERKFARCRPT
ncbi:LPD1 domain-containing protein [Reyranella sp.]|jgi:hypothetical protein|uniref:LPD1 domain-containing protein n=1 Tax=Reyranella sp. TaxID=1929291 RepID=UPI002F955211